MKSFYPLLIILLVAKVSFTQNINDNKVNFNYIQLPLIKVKDAFQTYETRIAHGYLASNKDSLTMLAMRKEQYEAAFISYKQNHDAIQTTHYTRLANWEKKVNAGQLTVGGKPLPKPLSPNYPQPPNYLRVSQVQLNTEIPDESIAKGISIDGFKKGLGGSILTIDVQAIRNIQITYKKSGTGTSTKYKYTCRYQLPVLVKFETPTEGVVLQEIILQNTQSYSMKTYKSKYEYLNYMLNNKQAFFLQLEASARKKAIIQANKHINNQLGYVKKTRGTEIYSVKKFKQYDYSDLTIAYSAAVSALQLVGNDKDHSEAKEKLETVLAQWKEVLFESNNYDKKARINDKISAVIQCNVAEIEFWLNHFDATQTAVNLAINSGVMKAKNHAKSAQHFYLSSKKRWDVHY